MRVQAGRVAPQVILRRIVRPPAATADDLDATMARLAEKGVACSEPKTASWGRTTSVPLPGGGSVGVYEAYHARA